MDELLKEVLGTVTLKKTKKGVGGCINEGEAYLIDTGTVFVKYNKKSQVNEDSWNIFVCSEQREQSHG